MPLTTTDMRENDAWLTTVVEINRRIRATLEAASRLTVSQYRILLEIAANESSLSCGALATMLFLTPSAITAAVDRLSEQGLVSRTGVQANRRVVLVDITERGLALLRATDAQLGKMLQSTVWCDLTTEQLEVLVRSTALSTQSLVGHSRVHGNVAVEPCYITCAIVQLKSYEGIVAKTGLSLNEFRVGVASLDREGPVRSIDVARELILDRNAASRAIIALGKKGVVQTEPCPTDSRTSMLSPTPAGEELLRAALVPLEAFDRQFCQVEEHVGPSNVGLFAQINKTLHATRA